MYVRKESRGDVTIIGGPNVLPSIGVPIGRIQNERSSILPTSTGKERQSDVVHLADCIFVQDVAINMTRGSHWGGEGRRGTGHSFRNRRSRKARRETDGEILDVVTADIGA